jgi:hypothetical protein
VVRRGTKIDNLVQIGHNCDVGEDVILVSRWASPAPRDRQSRHAGGAGGRGRPRDDRGGAPFSPPSRASPATCRAKSGAASEPALGSQAASGRGDPAPELIKRVRASRSVRELEERRA